MAWTKVCEKSEIPVGSIKKVWARIGGGIPIAVAHHKNGYVAVPPVCPHLEAVSYTHLTLPTTERV